MKTSALQRFLPQLCTAMIAVFPIATLTVGASSARAEDLVVNVKNNASVPLTELHLVPKFEGNWGNNILSGTIASGDSKPVRITNGRPTCTFDIQAIFANGDNSEYFSINLCETQSHTVSD